MPFRGDRLRGIREEKRLGRSDLAQLADLDPAGVQRLEDGDTPNPRSTTIDKLAEKLDVTSGYLMGEGPDIRFSRAIVLQALERFMKFEGWKYAPLDEQALKRAAECDNAYDTVAGWKAFVEMSNRAWGKPSRMIKVSVSEEKAPAARGTKPSSSKGSVRHFEHSKRGR